MIVLDPESIFNSISPSDLGMPSKFQEFRSIQRQAFEFISNQCTTAINALCVPPGGGKTLKAVAIARLLGVRAAYLVATKALESQVMDDFESVGMVNVHGRANYPCQIYDNCDVGYDQECSRRNSDGCEYACAVNAAKGSDIFVTNYSYWLNARAASDNALEDDFGRPIELLICDEAHSIESQLTGYGAVKLYAREHDLDHMTDGVMSPDDEGSAELFDCAKRLINKLANSNDDDDKDLCDRARKVARMNSNWTWQMDDKGSITLEPIHVSGFMKQLFSGVPRVLLMSASLDRFTCKLLLPSDMPFDYHAWSPVFPPSLSPVYHIPTVKLTRKSTDEDYQKLIEVMDAIIDSRLHVKGIIHTVSYGRSVRSIQCSRHRDRFIWNDSSRELHIALERFRSSGPGTLLVTPSVEEGHSFEGDQANYQILIKFPFPNEGQRTIKERCRRIPGYRLHYAANKVSQIKGRPIRSPTDWSELFILDNAVGQLNSIEGRSYMPPGFRIFTVNQIPPPMKPPVAK